MHNSFFQFFAIVKYTLIFIIFYHFYEIVQTNSFNLKSTEIVIRFMIIMKILKKMIIKLTKSRGIGRISTAFWKVI